MPNENHSPTYFTGKFIISSSIFFLIFLSFTVFINHIRIIDNYLLKLHNSTPFQIPLFSQTNCQQQLITTTTTTQDEPTITTNSTTTQDEPTIRLLIGILTVPDQYQRRDFLRRVYGIQSTSIPTWAKVDIKFIFCNLTKQDQHILISLEILHHNDIIILNCKENMDKGKTYTYFSSLPTIYPTLNQQPPYHYVMKADDDTFIRLHNLLTTLKPLAREDLYYGYVIPCRSMDPFKEYMSGMGYLVSWDIVEWIKESEIPKNHVVGPEDKVFGQWLKIGRKGMNRFNGKWMMYDYPIPHTQCTHELWEDTVAVHKLKTMEKWLHTLNYFNITNPSHMDNMFLS